MEDCLVIGINSRVMLRKNLIFKKGLINGALGYVTKINMQKNKISSISILFDGHKSKTKIERFQTQFELSKNVFITRSQFPIILAWGMTIHKCQGLSLKSILVDLGNALLK